MSKYIWVLFSLRYKLFFKKFSLPSYIAKPMYLKGCSNISVSRMVRIFPHARIECIGKSSMLNISENISIGPNVNITCAGEILIEKGVTISSNVFLTDMDHEYKKIDMPIMEQGNIVSKTVIGENSFIGTGAVILAGTSLGRQCIVAANAVVRGKFDNYSVIAGNPARVIKKYCTVRKEWYKI
ncbi:TPA: acyltransferase [Photobacterium damselae]